MISVYKIGGNVINNPKELVSFLENFSKIPGKKILVHGGGKEATELGEKLGIEARMVEGRRITDGPTLDLVTMVYAGLINKRIVSLLQERGCNAMGLTGADGNVIPAKKRNPDPIDYGFVGDINPVDINISFISLLLENNCVPIFCAICRNKEGGLLNCNADSIAAAIAVACSAQDDTQLIYCFEKSGVLSDLNDEKSLIPLITTEMFESLVTEGKISGGMIPKVYNALNAIRDGVNSVRICNAENISFGSGTVIKK